LGGGGAKGLAHVLMLEAFDELGIKPHRMAGTSMGAIVGALYACGFSGAEIRAGIDEQLLRQNNKSLKSFFRRGFARIIDPANPRPRTGGLIKGKKILDLLYTNMKISTFEELKIPLKIVAADFWGREEAVFSSGELLPAIRASMAFPLIFTPVLFEGRVLVDGGAVNPVPYDLLLGECDIIIAVDVMGRRPRKSNTMPSLMENVFNTIQIMERTILLHKMRDQPPDIYLEVDMVDIKALDFSKAEDIYRQAAPAKEKLKRELRSLLD